MEIIEGEKRKINWPTLASLLLIRLPPDITILRILDADESVDQLAIPQ